MRESKEQMLEEKAKELLAAAELLGLSRRELRAILNRVLGDER